MAMVEAEKNEKPIDYNKIAGALDSFLKAHPGKKHLVIGGTHEDEIGYYAIFENPHVIHKLQSHDMHTLAWEQPAAFERHLDKVMWDGMDAKTFADMIGQDKKHIGGVEQSAGGRQAFEMQVPLILAQRKYGNAMIYYDSPDTSLKAHYEGTHGAAAKLMQASRMAHEALSEVWVDRYILLQERGMQHTDENETRAAAQIRYEFYKTDPRIKAAYDDFLKLRISTEDEKARADYIKTHAVQGAVVWAGAAHGAGVGDLDELLDANRIVFVPDRESYHKESQRDFVLGNEAPEGYLIVSEGIIISGDQAYQAAAKFSAMYHQAMKDAPAPAPEVPTTELQQKPQEMKLR